MSDEPQSAASIDPVQAWHEGTTTAAERDDLHESWPLPAEVMLVTSKEEGVPPFVVSRFDVEDLETKDTNSVGMRWALTRFRDLAVGRPRDVQRFVLQFGPLWLRPDALPARVWPLSIGEPLIERVDLYLLYAKLVSATIRLASAARNQGNVLDADKQLIHNFIAMKFPDVLEGEPAEGDDDWMPEPGPADNPWPRAASLERPSTKSAFWAMHLAPSGAPFRRGCVMTIVNWWLSVGGVRPVVDWYDGPFRIAWTGGLWGAIGTQLLHAIQTERGPVLCSNCNGIVTGRQRKPKAGQRVWCARRACQKARHRLYQKESRGRRE